MGDIKPVIGIVCDWQAQGSFSKREHFALRCDYVNTVRLAGGIAFLIPYADVSDIDDYLDRIDGLLVPGGFYATPDDWYLGSDEVSIYEESPRFLFEKGLMLKVLKKDMPLLTICAGMQVLAGILGCKLTNNVGDYFNSDIDHFDENLMHEVFVEKGTILSDIVKKDKFLTNTHHNEGVVKFSDEVIVSAKAVDGCVEALEIRDKRFAIGLQWHPENLCSKKELINDENDHFKIFQRFIRECK